MATEGVCEMDVNRPVIPAPRSPERDRPAVPAPRSGEPDRLARRDQLILRLEVARRRRKLAQQTAHRLRPELLARLSD
jgi:hypothetical protein